MSTATATPTRRAFYASNSRPDVTFKGHVIESHPDGTAIVKDVPIFKAGSFRDSMGDLHEWTAGHLQLMVANFDQLRADEIFPDVPVRRDHSYSIDKVMGYFDSMRTDGVLLYADLHVTEPDAIDKLARGTFRSRSLEVGMYVTNTEAAFWPVVYGVAYVDIPAAEGLHNKDLEGKFFSMVNEKETNVSGTSTATPPADAGAGTQIHLHVNGTTGTVSTPPDDRAPARPAETTDNAAVKPVTHTFRVNGADVTDFAKVQSHIDALEGFQKETVENGRKAFVASLATDGKITAPMVEEMSTHALSLTPEGYASFKAMYEKAPKLSITSEHGNGNGAPNTAQDGGKDKRQNEIDTLTEQIQMHRDAGMKDEDVHKTKAWSRLQELTKS